MNAQQIELINRITRLALSGSEQTGKRIYHEVTAWGEGDVWSHVRVVGASNTSLHDSEAIIDNEDDAVPEYAMHLTRCTLTEQYAALEKWIADNRKQEAA